MFSLLTPLHVVSCDMYGIVRIMADCSAVSMSVSVDCSDLEVLISEFDQWQKVRPKVYLAFYLECKNSCRELLKFTEKTKS